MSWNDTTTMSLDDDRPQRASIPAPRSHRQRLFGLVIAVLIVASLVLAYQNRSGAGSSDDADSIRAGSNDPPTVEPDTADEQEQEAAISDGGPSITAEPDPTDSAAATVGSDDGEQATFTSRTTERATSTETSAGTVVVSTTRPSTTDPTTTLRTTTSSTERPSTTAAPTTTRPTTTAPPTTTTTTRPPPIALTNGGFDQATVPVGAFRIVSSTPGWVSSTGEFEIWGTGHNSIEAAGGSHFIELNANKPATLHQDFATTPGTTIQWQFSHRGRTGVETVELSLGPADGRLTSVQVAGTGQAWVRYQGTYRVPAGQTRTRIAIASRTPGPEGNLVDEISVSLVR